MFSGLLVSKRKRATFEMDKKKVLHQWRNPGGLIFIQSHTHTWRSDKHP